MNTPDSRPARIGIVTVSDRASRGDYEDRGGPEILRTLGDYLCSPWEPVTRVIPDDRDQIAATLTQLADEEGCDLVVTTGGTGPAPRDVTPEATESVCHRIMPGFGELMRAVSLRYVPTAILSCQTAGIRGSTLIVNLPGKPKAIRQCLDAVFPAIPYCLDLIGAAWLDTDASVIEAFRPGEVSVMADIESWLQRWEEGRIGFHREGTHPLLERYAARLPPSGRVFVPFSGKSHDLLWLEAGGFEVVACEVVRLAVEAFHLEHGRMFSRAERGGVEIYRSGGITTLCGDLFEIDPRAVGLDAACDLVYDRAALVACRPDLRQRYVEKLCALLRPGGRVLLVGLHYDQCEMPGPPYSVPPEEVARLFEERFAVEILETREALGDQPVFRERGLSALDEAVYLLTAIGA